MAYTNDGGGTCVDCQEEMGQREGNYQGSDALDEAVPVVGSQGVEKGARIFNLPIPNIPSDDVIPVGSSPKFFTKGLHQTIDGWRSYRHEDGWKMQ
jgi:hypothetical protein